MREDWVVAQLGKLATKITKGSTPTTYGYKFQNEGVNFIKIENVKNGFIMQDSIVNFISEEAHNSQERSKLQEGDILFSIAGAHWRNLSCEKQYSSRKHQSSFCYN